MLVVCLFVVGVGYLFTLRSGPRTSTRPLFLQTGHFALIEFVEGATGEWTAVVTPHWRALVPVLKNKLLPFVCDYLKIRLVADWQAVLVHGRDRAHPNRNSTYVCIVSRLCAAPEYLGFNIMRRHFRFMGWYGTSASAAWQTLAAVRSGRCVCVCRRFA